MESRRLPLRPPPHRRPRPAAPTRQGHLPNGDYYLHITEDLRLGTFGHPWEQTLTVWGPTLLAAVEADLAELLGTPIRHRE
ncbi:DUF2716 domain-containing protein [Streptomyces sp. NPDC059957]|uniref:DUF2716 domain-containing protein n=1 Tax=Streptomyces sp. NPDC059957 TaxID=3347016 RepID=UPI003649C149